MGHTVTVPKMIKATLAVTALLALGACGAPRGASRTITLGTLNDSGVTGSVKLTDVGTGLTEVVVHVEAAGNLDMPAHIHPGTCVDLVPQPRYPLRNVVNGDSTTVVPGAMADLLAGDLAVNLHRSNDDLATGTACADLR